MAKAPQNIQDGKELMGKHCEVVAYSSIFGLLVPIIFIVAEKDIMKQCWGMIYPFGGLFLITVFAAIVARGSLINLPSTVLRITIYTWGAGTILASA